MHPATTYDLEIEQRGEELILTFTYPQTTISGLPLAELAKVEYWEVKKPVPEWVEPGAESEEDAAQASDATEDETGGEETTLQAEDPEDLEGIDEKDAEDQEGDEAEEDETEDEMPDEEPVAMTPPVPAPLPPTKEQIAAVEVLEFDATAQLKITLEGAELDAAIVGDKISLRIPFSEADREEETAFIYAVKTFADPRRGTGLSNLATLVRREPPAAPRDFEVEAEAGGVRVSWFNDKAVSLVAATGETPVATPVAQDPATDPALEDEEELEILAYRIYRRAAQARVYGLHIAEVMGTADEYVDRTAQYGNRYIYSLTGLALRLPLVQSALAGEAEVDYQDRFAPPVPRNVLAFAEPGRVRLLWDASPAPDLAGYIVFHRSAGW